MLSRVMVLLLVQFASANPAVSVIESHTKSIANASNFSTKWKEFEKLNTNLKSLKSQNTAVIIDKNSMLELFTLFDKAKLAKKDCKSIQNKIDLDYKVDMRSGFETTRYYQDALKILSAFCK